MSPTLSPPPARPGLRRPLPRLSRDPETRSVQIGVIGTLLVHLLLFFVVPKFLRFDPPLMIARDPAPKEYSINIEPETFDKPEEKTPPKFVETNPDAPENEPDKTTNFAARSQQVAQEKPTPDGKNDMPALEGKKDFESTQIVSGQLSKPVEAPEPAPALETPPNAQPITPPKLEQIPLPGFDKKDGESLSSFGTDIGKVTDVTTPAAEKVDGQKNVPLFPGATATTPQIDPQRPRPRPSIVSQPQVRPAIFAENKIGTSNIGPIAVDARWSNYGAYLQRMIETVQLQWEHILHESKIYPTPGSSVSVKFIMNSDGAITRVVDVQSTATDSASRACMSAITDRSPYGKWTEDMTAVLGDQQEMTFRFFYQ